MSEPRKSMSRLRAVMARFGLGRDTIYRLVRNGEFPKPYRLTKRTTAWKDDELDEWFASRQHSTLPSPNARAKAAATAGRAAARQQPPQTRKAAGTSASKQRPRPRAA